MTIENGLYGAGAGAVTGAGIGLLGGIFDPVTIPAGAIIGGIIGGTTGLLSGDTITKKTINQNQYISQTQYKSNEVIIGANSKVNNINFKDTMTQDATESATATQTKPVSNTLSYLLLGGAGIGALYLVNKKGGRK